MPLTITILTDVQQPVGRLSSLVREPDPLTAGRCVELGRFNTVSSNPKARIAACAAEPTGSDSTRAR
jgi:hypothetical protein